MFTFDTAKLLMLTAKDGLNQTTTYQYDAQNRPVRVIAPGGSYPGGDYVEYSSDSRGNVDRVTKVAKAGSGLADIVTSASYDSTCTVAVRCNQPNSTTDARGNVTGYTYDDTHGGVLTVTAPAPTTNAVQPQTRITYARVNSSGVEGSVGVFRPKTVSSCRTLATCAGTADERKTTVTYGNNQNVATVAVGAGDGTLTATTSLTYDAVGNRLSTDGPLSGTADKSLTFYDALRRPTGSIGPDPDGAGAALFQLVQYVYGQTASSITSGLGPSPRSRVAGRAGTAPTCRYSPTMAITAVSATRSTTGRLRQTTRSAMWCTTRLAASCAAFRYMNRSTFGSAAPAHLLHTLPDHRRQWPRPRHLQPLRRARSGMESDERLRHHGRRGRRDLDLHHQRPARTLTDAVSNKTTYAYDGHDRLVRAYFPQTTQGANASAMTARAGRATSKRSATTRTGNVTSFTTRRGETLTMTYDNLDRLIRKTVPERTGLSRDHTRDVFFGYDLYGGLGSACFGDRTNTPETITPDCVTNTFDALGQLTSATTYMDSVRGRWAIRYNVAGSRTRLTYPDGHYITSDRYASGAFSMARSQCLSGAAVFSDKGRGRASLGRALEHLDAEPGAGHLLHYYDGISRESGYTRDLAGTSYDTTSTFTHNPASQIVSRARNNDLYASTGSALSTTTTPRTASISTPRSPGPASTYDAGGNLAADGTHTYTYDVENRLVARAGPSTSATLRYDPLGRLYEVYGSDTAITRFLYDGDALVAEYYRQSGTLLSALRTRPGRRR